MIRMHRRVGHTRVMGKVFSSSVQSSKPSMSQEMAHPFPLLFSPLRLGDTGHTLKNRIIMGSMHTGLEEPPLFGTLDEMAAFYEVQ